MITSLTSEETILPKALPMMTPTARSMTLPLMAKALKSCQNDMPCSFPSDGSIPTVMVGAPSIFALIRG